MRIDMLRSNSDLNSMSHMNGGSEAVSSGESMQDSISGGLGLNNGALQDEVNESGVDGDSQFSLSDGAGTRVRTRSSEIDEGVGLDRVYG